MLLNIRAWSSLPELKNSMSFSYFSKPELKKSPVSKDCQNPKINTRSNPFLNYEKFRQIKMYFGQILVKIYSQTCKLKN